MLSARALLILLSSQLTGAPALSSSGSTKNSVVLELRPRGRESEFDARSFGICGRALFARVFSNCLKILPFWPLSRPKLGGNFPVEKSYILAFLSDIY